MSAGAGSRRTQTSRKLFARQRPRQSQGDRRTLLSSLKYDRVGRCSNGQEDPPRSRGDGVQHESHPADQQRGVRGVDQVHLPGQCRLQRVDQEKVSSKVLGLHLSKVLLSIKLRSNPGDSLSRKGSAVKLPIRFSDFTVREITPDGTVLYLKPKKTAVAKVEPAASTVEPAVDASEVAPPAKESLPAPSVMVYSCVAEYFLCIRCLLGYMLPFNFLVSGL